MKKKLAWWLWLPLSAVSPLALAVGLGQATVNSPLQSPLDATVPLVDAAGVALDDVRVEIANEAAFNALGLEWTPLVASVRAELQHMPGGPQLVLRSEQAVSEPWLDLLVTITTPEGRRTEAIMLLFDPPNYAASVDATVAEASSVAQPVPSQSLPAAPAAPAQTPERNIAYIASGDTLWGVAERIKPADVSVQQMMMALVEGNPAAFPTGNVDDIRAGQTLRVPSREQLMALSPAQAAQAVQAMRRPSPRSASAPETESEEQAESTTVAEPLAQPDARGSDAAPSEPQSTEDAQETVVQEGELAGLTLRDLAEQLQESQAMLQMVLEEREQMRAEMAALRQEVASLTEALNASQRETQRALAAAESRAANATIPASAAVNTSSTPSLIERLEAYQWPLASVALALLLGALIWSRKRRERQWEEVASPAPQRSEPSAAASPKEREAVQPAAAAFTTASVMDMAADESQQTPPVAGSHDKEEGRRRDAFEYPAEEPLADSHDEPLSSESFSLVAEAPTAQQSVDHEGDTLWETQDEEDKADTEGASSMHEEDEAALNAAFLETPEPVEDASYREHAAQEAEVPPATVAEEKDDSAHYIDYHPPSLTNDFGSADEPVWGERASENAKASPSYPRREPEEEWEIEEVAFEPRRRDNS